MTLLKGAEELNVDQLSSGEKSLLALVGDLSRRLGSANPGLANPNEGKAVVLIDEIELHLHPGWQRVVVDRLTTTFPNCQFILTTHSPQVLSSVPASSVVALKDFARYPLPAGTDGRDSNSLLTEVMGVSERPQWAADELHRVAKLMDEGNFTASREALHALAARMGEHDAELVRLRTLVDFLEGKA
jgi:predicted ATP-binding protein involved in virulence